ncbi:unnamed protein product [Aureobasidium vineae]|uniref:BSD domain-containing protein n=1 Tax=Aureobasidium vineae TaxID=2773715 RepID=A0A9N8JLQ1_9PEZI|nr:unnamed protein product [Aureobasidium vineae]
MDFAYDQIQEESLPSDREGQQNTTDRPPTDLNTEFQQAFKAVSSSPWGAKLGGFWSQAKKQGESLYSDAQKEYASRNPTFALPEGAEVKEKEAVTDTQPGAAATRPDSLPADIVKEATSLVSLLRSKATAATANLNLQKIQQAEDAADEALLKFGTGIKSFLRDAVTVTAPSASGSTEVLFETNDAEGKRVIHSSRFDAQLHVIHTSAQSFTSDPDSPEYGQFTEDFDISAKTDAIAADLEKYPELRRAMEKLVPEKVEYAIFWTRYYFLRKVIQEEEVRRREVLKEKTPVPATTATPTASSTAPTQPTTSTTKAEPQHHEEETKSVSSSDASYDIVSGTTSRATGSPKDEKSEVKAAAKIDEESDEEDWE